MYRFTAFKILTIDAGAAMTADAKQSAFGIFGRAAQGSLQAARRAYFRGIRVLGGLIVAAVHVAADNSGTTITPNPQQRAFPVIFAGGGNKAGTRASGLRARGGGSSGIFMITAVHVFAV